MNLNFTILRALYGNELRMVFRDRRTIITAVVLPLVVMPLILFGSSWTNKRRERALATATYHYTVTGSEAQRVRGLVAATQERLRLAATNSQKRTFHFEEKSVTNALNALNRGEIHFFVEGGAGIARKRSELRSHGHGDLFDPPCIDTHRCEFLKRFVCRNEEPINPGRRPSLPERGKRIRQERVARNAQPFLLNEPLNEVIQHRMN